MKSKELLLETQFNKQGEDWDSFLWRSPLLEERAKFNHVFRAIHWGDKLSINTFLEYDKWIKSPIYEQFLAGESRCSERDRGVYLLSIQLKGFLWTARRSMTHYEGIGGVWVAQKPFDSSGFIIEPLDNWLAVWYPRPEEY